MATGGDTVNITNAYEDSRLANDVEYSFYLQELKLKSNQLSQDLLSIFQFVSISSNARKKGCKTDWESESFFSILDGNGNFRKGEKRKLNLTKTKESQIEVI